jgi:hypothetical protein
MTMHTVIETPDYLQDANDAGLSDEEMAAIVQIIASDPKAGDLMVGTGGARKLRFAAGGKGKRGGVRTVHYTIMEVATFPFLCSPSLKKAIATIFRRRNATPCGRNSRELQIFTERKPKSELLNDR